MTVVRHFIGGDWADSADGAPFGGMKDSGIGREGGLHSEEFFTEAKAVVIQFSS